ncbi:sorting and assembly machinery component 50 homolog [Actinia tenebrosa]|uniref:Sorting and assembly machinery component 50 homolog n=1 Tax=Actinia tenebrosa TaxID=6105 RepID=A0A6P8H0F9_ACTTE|nr:sorting and assembly machinery component 50 homolog [Actinia tenebrosa]
MVFGAKLNNVFGKAEGLKADLGFGTKTKSSYQLVYTKPVSINPSKSFQVGVQKATTDYPTSSHKELTHGVNFSYTLPSNLGVHTIGWEGVWRNLTGMEPRTSFSVRKNAGHSLKSSLTHMLVADTRDHPSFPTEGSLFKLTQELAGLGGDVQFLKNNIETQKNVEIREDVVLSCSAQGGIMNAPPNTRTRINDRFFLGGPLSVRGFHMKGIGPRDRMDSLGAEAYWSVGLHLYTPLPFRPAQGSFGDHIKTHVFVNAGNLVSIDSSLPWKQQLNPLVQNTRWSCGVGLVLLLGIARLELNYCLPRGYQRTDRINRGLQFGLGVNFL